tara:strand:+ start:279 stop:455 length:177 start_codon:yes stop_codon:yes gene_type:complete
MSTHELTAQDLDLLHELTTDHLEQTMRGDWLAVRHDVSKLHCLLARIIRLQIKLSANS